MTRITVDDAFRKKLGNVVEPIELCDEKGVVFAKDVPLADLSRFEPWVPELSEEELQKIEQADEWYTSEQVFAHLKNLEDG